MDRVAEAAWMTSCQVKQLRALVTVRLPDNGGRLERMKKVASESTWGESTWGVIASQVFARLRVLLDNSSNKSFVRPITCMASRFYDRTIER